MNFPNITELFMDDVALMKKAREDILPLPEAAVGLPYGLSPSRAIIQKLHYLQQEYEEAKSISIKKINIAKKKYKTFKKPALKFMNSAARIITKCIRMKGELNKMNMPGGIDRENSVQYALLLIFKEEFNKLQNESGVPMSDEIKNDIFDEWFENFKRERVPPIDLYNRSKKLARVNNDITGNLLGSPECGCVAYYESVFSMMMKDVREQAYNAYDAAEKRELEYYNRCADKENARIVWLCGGTPEEIEALECGEMIENFDMYREKFKKFQTWKKLHDVMNVPDHYVASDFREWDKYIVTDKDYDNYAMDLDFYM
jgi:hypothetical protein